MPRVTEGPEPSEGRSVRTGRQSCVGSGRHRGPTVRSHASRPRCSRAPQGPCGKVPSLSHSRGEHVTHRAC